MSLQPRLSAIAAAFFLSAFALSIRASDIAPASAEAVQKLRNAGAVVMPLSTDSPLLEVSFVHSQSPVGDESLNALSELAPQIASLNLAGAKATAEGWSKLSALANLTRLHAENSSIDDRSLTVIAALPRLEYLNLYGTAVTDDGLKSLESCKTLRSLFLWKTKASDTIAEKLKAAVPALAVDLGYDHPSVVRARLTKELETVKKSEEAATAKSAALEKELAAARQESDALVARHKEIETSLAALNKPADAPPAPPASQAPESKK